MRVFLDTNIILDAIIPEREHRKDAIQMSCADLEGCDCIITHDSKHFRTYCQLPAYTAAEFIEGCRRRGRESRL